jgi:hypothetical protein
MSHPRRDSQRRIFLFRAPLENNVEIHPPLSLLNPFRPPQAALDSPNPMPRPITYFQALPHHQVSHPRRDSQMRIFFKLFRPPLEIHLPMLQAFHVDEKYNNRRHLANPF